MQKQHNGQGEWLPSFKMLPMVGAEVENETKDSLYLRCEVRSFDVAESETI